MLSIEIFNLFFLLNFFLYIFSSHSKTTSLCHLNFAYLKNYYFLFFSFIQIQVWQPASLRISLSFNFRTAPKNFVQTSSHSLFSHQKDKLMLFTQIIFIQKNSWNSNLRYAPSINFQHTNKKTTHWCSHAQNFSNGKATIWILNLSVVVSICYATYSSQKKKRVNSIFSYFFEVNKLNQLNLCVTTFNSSHNLIWFSLKRERERYLNQLWLFFLSKSHFICQCNPSFHSIFPIKNPLLFIIWFWFTNTQKIGNQ